jgi:hypothetical protein
MEDECLEDSENGLAKRIRHGLHIYVSAINQSRKHTEEPYT